MEEPDIKDLIVNFRGTSNVVSADTDLIFLSCKKNDKFGKNSGNFKHMIDENEKDVFYTEDSISNNYKLVRSSKDEKGKIYFSTYCKYSTLSTKDSVCDKTTNTLIYSDNHPFSITSEYVIDKKESLPKCSGTSNVLYVIKDTSNKLSIEHNLEGFSNSFHEFTLYVFAKDIAKNNKYFWQPCKILKLKTLFNNQKAQKNDDGNATVEFITFFVFLVIIISIILCIVMLVRRRKKRNYNANKVDNEEKNKMSVSRSSTWNIRVART